MAERRLYTKITTFSIGQRDEMEEHEREVRVMRTPEGNVALIHNDGQKIVIDVEDIQSALDDLPFKDGEVRYGN